MMEDELIHQTTKTFWEIWFTPGKSLLYFMIYSSIVAIIHIWSDFRRKDNTSFDFDSCIIWAIGFPVCLAVIIGVIYTIIHAIIKYW